MLKKKVVRIVLLALVVLVTTAVPLRADPHVGQSVNVAVIGSLFVQNGGSFPTTTMGPTGSFTDFTFTVVPAASVNAATLALYDTVLLNVASGFTPGVGLACNVNNLTAGQKTDLVNFLNGGGKLIIYDSECNPQDYSWLPRPFTTSNPGALGGVGTVNIVEDNLLGSDTVGDSHFIDEVLLGAGTDAVGDMNVLTTTDPNICLHMSGTNAANQSGPTHVYYQSGSGLLIYNGFDVDFMSTFTVPNSSTGAGNVAKIWLQELQQPRNGQGLACAVAVVGIAIAPLNAENVVGSPHTVTATVTNQAGNPQPNVLVRFEVTGANATAGAAGTCNPSSCQTNAQGQVTFTYTGTVAGEDKIKACFTPTGGSEVCSALATKVWTTAATSADVSVTKTDAPDPATAGEELTYTITVSNAGPDPAESVTLTDVLPGTVTHKSTTTTQGSCSGTTTVTCNLGTVAVGSPVTVTIKVTPTDDTDLMNTASAASQTTADPNTTNNQDTESTVVDPAGPRCNGLDATFVGDDGDDYFQGGPGVDVVVDSGGDNYLQTGGGNDHVCLGDGDDEIDTGDGDDFVDAGDGKNKVKTGNGSDTVRSGTGDDEIDTGDGDDTVTDTGGRNKIFTGNGSDRVTSGSGNDEIETGNGDDVVVDSGGNNTVKTNDGADQITTGAGNDKIDGGNGFDTCSPGGGSNEVKDCEA